MRQSAWSQAIDEPLINPELEGDEPGEGSSDVQVDEHFQKREVLYG